MITEQELKDRTTSNFIKWCCEYAEGFRLLNDYTLFAFESFDCRINGVHESLCLFPLLIHRSVEEISKKYKDQFIIGVDYEEEECYIITTKSISLKSYPFKNYQPESLTHAECACLHCLLDIFAEASECQNMK